MALLFGGSRTLMFTSGGSDRGDMASRDSHFDVLENDRDVVLTETAGTRKSGRREIAP